MAMGDEVSLWIDAEPADVWALLSDVTRIGELSPETFEAEWLGGVSGPEVGAKFRGHVKRNGVGPTYWTSCKVTSCEVDRDFGFAVYGPGGPINNWRYQLRPESGGTQVTESFQLAPRGANRIYWLLLGWHRSRANRKGMMATLSRAKEILETKPAS